MKTSGETDSVVQAEEGASVAEGSEAGRACRIPGRKIVLALLTFHLIQEINPTALGNATKGFKILV